MAKKKVETTIARAAVVCPHCQRAYIEPCEDKRKIRCANWLYLQKPKPIKSRRAK